MGKKIRIISRQSRLALLQVEELVKEAGITDYELIKTTSYGDRHKEVSLMDEGLHRISSLANWTRRCWRVGQTLPYTRQRICQIRCLTA